MKKDNTFFKLQFKKFLFLTYYGVKKRVWNKTFLIANIIILFISLFILFIPKIFKDQDKHEYKIDLVLNKDDEKIKKALEDIIIIDNKYSIGDIKIDKDNATIEKQKEFYKDKKFDAVVISNFNDQNNYNDLKLSIIHSNNFKNNSLKNLTSKLENIKIKLKNLEKNPYEIKIETQALNQEKINRKKMAKIIALVILVLSGFIVSMLINILGTEIIKEKETKAVEIILTSVTPKVHFLSKITSILLFLLIQSIIILIYFVLTTLISGNANLNQTNIPLSNIFLDPVMSSTILFTIGFGIIGLLIMLLLTGMIASMSNSFEEYQSAITPISFLTFVPGYLALFLIDSTSNITEIILRILSYIPILSTFISPVTYYARVTTWYEGVISLLISLSTLILLIYFFSPIYKKNILSFSKSKFLEKFTQFFKTKGTKK